MLRSWRTSLPPKASRTTAYRQRRASAGQTVFHLHWHVLGGKSATRVPLSDDCGQTVIVELIATIENELKQARLAREDDRRDALMPDPLQPALGGEGAAASASEDEELQVLQRERKKRVEAFEAFEAAGREEQADRRISSSRCLRSSCPSRFPTTSSTRSSTT